METVGIAPGAKVTMVLDGCTSMARAAVENIGILMYNKILGMRDSHIMVSTIASITQFSSERSRTHLNGNKHKFLRLYALFVDCNRDPNTNKTWYRNEEKMCNCCSVQIFFLSFLHSFKYGELSQSDCYYFLI